MKILVCGGRDFRDYVFLEEVLDSHAISSLVHGGARGADSLAKRYAKERGIKTFEHLPDWNSFGPAAGPLRNQQMLDSHPDIQLVVAFPGGRGTADMVRRATTAGVKVLKPRREAPPPGNPL